MSSGLVYAPRVHSCAGCGGPLDSRTPGCENCRKRLSARDHREDIADARRRRAPGVPAVIRRHRAIVSRLARGMLPDVEPLEVLALVVWPPRDFEAALSRLVAVGAPENGRRVACSGCGGSYADVTEGCETCADRFRGRAKRRERRAAARAA